MEHSRSCAVSCSRLVVVACFLVAMPSAALGIVHSVQRPELGMFVHQANKHGQTEECPHKGSEYASWCGKPRTAIDTPQKLYLATTLLLAKDIGGGICTSHWQDYTLASIFSTIGTTNKYFLECGVRAPQRAISAHFRLNCDWQGLLLDGASSANQFVACPDCADVQALLGAPDLAPVRLRRVPLTIDNVNDVLNEAKVPHSFDLLTVDIDGGEYWVLRGLNMSRFSPRVVAVRFNSYFSKDQVLVPKYQPGRDSHPPETIGASLAALNDWMTHRGYSYVAQVAGEHAFWVLDSALNETDRNSTQIPDRVEEGWQSTGAVYKATNYQKPPAETANATAETTNDTNGLTVDDMFTHYQPR